MTRTVRVEIDDDLHGVVSCKPGEEQEVDHIFGSLGVNLGKGRKHPKANGLVVLPVESVTVETLDRPLLRSRLEKGGFDVHDDSTL